MGKAFDTEVHGKRGSMILLAVTDRRVSPVYSQKSGGVFGAINGPTYLAIGREVTNEQLKIFAELEGIEEWAKLIEFRDRNQQELAHG
jgi:hypothetical protein